MSTQTATKSLDKLSSEIAGAFSISFFELETIRAVAGEFSRDVAQLLQAVEDGADREKQENAVAAFLANATSAAEAAERAAKSLTDRSFQDALARISGSLLEMKKHAIILLNVSSLTKITQTETKGVGDQLQSFTGLLDDRCRRLQDATVQSTDLIVETQRQSGLARDRLTAIGQEFRSLSNGADRDTDRRKALEADHHAQMDKSRETSHRLNDEVSLTVRNLIGCLQFPDAFAQRMEHVRNAVDAIEKGTAPERAAIAKVAAAQLDAMAASLTQVAGNAVDALDHLHDAVQYNPLAQSGAAASNPSDIWMAAMSQANDVMLASVDRARGQLGGALEVLSALTGQIDRTQGNLEEWMALNRELEITVHNASLVVHRSGSQTSPLRFLAGSVKEIVDRTSGLITEFSDALTFVRTTSQALTVSSLKDDLQKLTGFQEASAQEAAAQAEKVKAVDKLRRCLIGHAERLSGAASAGRNAFAAASDHAAAVSAMADEVRAMGGSGDARDADIGWLFNSYTMEEERQVHRQAMGIAEPEQAQDDEDLEDFMF